MIKDMSEGHAAQTLKSKDSGDLGWCIWEEKQRVKDSLQKCATRLSGCSSSGESALVNSSLLLGGGRQNGP